MPVKYTTCPLCEANCGLEVQVEEEQILKITGDKDDPFSKGYMCVKGRALKELHEDPDRLRHPMIREGEQWRTVSWDEALSFAANGIRKIQKKYSRNAVSVYQGNPLGHSAEGIIFYIALTKVLRTKNLFSAASLDQLPHMLVADELYGSLGMFTVPDVDRTDFMVIMGANPLQSNGSIMTAPNIKNRLKSIQKRGGKIIAIDPRKTETAQFANQHLPIQPGTDAFFLLAFIHVLFRDNLVDTGKLTSIVYGLAEIKELVKPFPPDSVATITGIDPATLENLAHEFSSATSAVFYLRIGASTQEFGTFSHWLGHLVNILTANLDKEGGMMFAKPAIDFVKTARLYGETGSFGKNKSRVDGYPSFRGELPVAAMIDEMRTEGKDQVKALVTLAGNPVLSSPNGKLLEKHLSELEFMVSIDIYKNETTRFANVILPPCFALERDRLDLAFPMMSVRNRIKYSGAVLHLPKDSKTDGEILKLLGARLAPVAPLVHAVARLFSPVSLLLDYGLRRGAYGNHFIPFTKGLTLRKVKQQVHGIDLGALTPVLPGRLFTKNKKINLASAIIMADVDRINQKMKFLRTKVRAENEFLMIGKRDMRSNNSWFHNLPKISEDKLSCTLLIHPEDAKVLGIKTDQWINVSSNTGRIRIQATLTDEVLKGVVCMPHGWGHDRPDTQLNHAKLNPGASINDLTDHQHTDRLSGTSVLNGFTVFVNPA